MKKQPNQYDKIFRENIEAVIPGLIQNILRINILSMEELPDDVQHTKERKPDVLKRITDLKDKTFVLHIEFQLTDEQDMLHRMAEYYIMLNRKYKLPVRQFVVFLGNKHPKMPTKYESQFMRFEFPLVSFSKLDYQLFLNSNKPEEIVLSILADFKQENPENAIKQILERIEETTDGDFSLKRYYKQLRILSQLRNLDLKLENIMISTAEFFKEERDFLYKRGFDKGAIKAREKEQTKFVTNLLKKSDLNFEQIAEITEVSVEFVKKVKQTL